jgi:Holliday junction resolvase
MNDTIAPTGLPARMQILDTEATRIGQLYREGRSSMASGGRAPRAKGNRAERALVAHLHERSLAAERIPLSGSAGGSFCGDITIPLPGRDLIREVKCRRNGFSQLYAWLHERDALIVKPDRNEPLVVLRLSLATETAAVAEQHKHTGE